MQLDRRSLAAARQWKRGRAWLGGGAHARQDRVRAAMGSRIFADNVLDGQVILVTGGGSGLGRATAVELAQGGATVVVARRGPARGRPRSLGGARAGWSPAGGSTGARPPGRPAGAGAAPRSGATSAGAH